MTKFEYWQYMAKQLADNIDTDHEIISTFIRGLLPKSVHVAAFKKLNSWIADKSIRHTAFNIRQMRRGGYSRIN